MDVLKNIQDPMLAVAAIITTLYAAFKFLERPNKENERQTAKLDSIETTINSQGRDLAGSIGRVSEELIQLNGKIQRVIDAQHESEKRVIVIENELKHHEESMRALRDSHYGTMDKIADALHKISEQLNPKK